VDDGIKKIMGRSMGFMGASQWHLASKGNSGTKFSIITRITTIVGATGEFSTGD
jgi:hypothetical protein